MHIVQITTELRPAGAEVVLLNLVRGLRAAGDRVSVISLQPLPSSSPIVDGLRSVGAEIHSLEMSKRQPWRLWRLRRLLADLQPDLVHAHLLHANLASRLAAPRSRAWPLINTVHIAERRADKGWHFRLDAWTLGRCDCQTAVSQAVSHFHAARLGIPVARIPVIYNGIDLPPMLDADRIASLRTEWQVDGCERVIGSVGRLADQKGYDILLGMLPALGRAIPAGERWGLVILGEGPDRPQLEALAADAPANLTVRLPGFRADAATAAGAFDLFVMPSRYEGFGLVLVEAMAHGIPVLANAVDSLPELVAHYPAGETLAMHPDAADNVSATMVRLAHGPRGEPLRSFTADVMVEAYRQLYQQFLPA